MKKRLSKTENLWLASLTNSLNEKETAQKLLNSYNKHKESPLYRSVMETISKNNRTLFEEDENMCQTLEDILDKKIAKENSRINNLALKLIDLNRIEDLIKSAKDPDYQSQLLEEFGI